MDNKEKVVSTMKELSAILKELQDNPDSGWYHDELYKLNKLNTSTEGLRAGEYTSLRWQLDQIALGLALQIIESKKD